MRMPLRHPQRKTVRRAGSHGTPIGMLIGARFPELFNPIFSGPDSPAQKLPELGFLLNSSPSKEGFFFSQQARPRGKLCSFRLTPSTEPLSSNHPNRDADGIKSPHATRLIDSATATRLFIQVKMRFQSFREVELIMQRAFELDIPQTLEDICDPTRLALIVYDMQIGIVKQIENGQEITDKALQVLDAARKAGVRVFFTRHMSLPKELMGVSQFRMAMAWQRVKSPNEVKPWFLRDAPGFHLIPEINPLPSEAIFDKITMSAFEGTPLNIALRDCGIDAFAIVGIAMEIGIEPTVRQGSDLGYITVVVKDACGFGHREAAERSIASLEFAGNALLTNVETICVQFRRIQSQQAAVRA
jgi:nicotinamidase-related amidase